MVPLFSLLLWSCDNSSKTSEASVGNQAKSTSLVENQKIQRVEVVKPGKRKFTGEITITGTAEPNQQVELHAMESGYVKKILKDIGETVRKGEVIAILDNPELYRELEKVKARLHAKQSAYDRLKGIFEKTPALTTTQSVEEAEADYLAAKSEYDAVTDRISFLKIKAPFSGIITERFVDDGALVQNGISSSSAKPLVRVQEINPVRVSVPLPESDLASVKKGTEVDVYFPELPGKSFKAKISRTASSLDPASKTMKVEIDIPNPDGMIKPGMYAKAKFTTGGREETLSLPVHALISHKDAYFVLMVQDKQVKQVPLRKGLANKDWFEVLDADISQESLIIIEGKGLVKPGQFVEPVLRKE